ncbi:MAG: efflux RND transporter periplasmic adaptor subunit [Proteobacteria bacterium]|nr:efflux RND transporter periplasmic adaptor subunit [Pseudomonadota bacterium]
MKPPSPIPNVLDPVTARAPVARHRNRLARWLTPLLAVSLALALPACKRAANATGTAQAASAKADGQGAKKPDDAVPVEVASVSRRPISASYNGTASLDAPDEAQVIAKTSGIVLQLFTEEGQQVRKGQVLVKLDSERQRLQVAQAQAQVDKLQANFNRSQKMLAAKLVSASDNDQIKYDLQNAKVALDMARLELSYTDVVAPISGIVAQRSIKVGNFVQINSPIIRIIDDSKLQATLNVPERELTRLKGGLPVTMEMDALPGKSFQGTVDHIAPIVDAGSGTFRVVCRFAGNGLLQPGMFGRIRIDYDRRADALVVPRLALLDDAADPAVFVVRDGKARRVTVAVGFTDGQWAEIRSGLAQGDAVVTAGKAALRDGSPVTVIAGKVDAKLTASTAASGAGSD